MRALLNSPLIDGMAPHRRWMFLLCSLRRKSQFGFSRGCAL